MKSILITLLALLPLVAAAQQDDELRARMREAELRLEQAAQEIAELSNQLSGDAIGHVIKTVRTAGGEGRAMLGVNIGRIHIDHDDGTVEDSGDDPNGVVILGVTPAGPAAEAGLASGDVILELNGTPLTGNGLPAQENLMSLMGKVTPGETVTVRYRRGNKEESVQVVTREFNPMSFAMAGPDENYKFEFNGEDVDIDDLPGMMGHFPGFAHLSKHRAWRGLELVPLTPKLGSYFGADSGLLVVRVPDGNSIALEEGDVILNIAGATPDSPPEAMRLLRFYKPGDEVVIEVRRQNRNQTLKVVVPE